MEKNLYIDASHPDETRGVLKSEKYIEEYEYENKNKLHLKNNIFYIFDYGSGNAFCVYAWMRKKVFILG